MFTIEDITGLISEASDPIDMHSYNNVKKTELPKEAFEMLTEYSRPRADLFVQWMQHHGYEAAPSIFSRYGAEGKNIICKKQEPRHLCIVHHDYWGGEGADDNGSGMAILMDCAQNITREDIGFISFDLEEVGRIGSRRYAQEHTTEDIESLLCIDTVSSGEGVMAAYCTIAGAASSEWYEEKISFSDENLVRRVTSQAKKLGYKVLPGYMTEGASDSKSFPMGVPKLNLYSFMPSGHFAGTFGKGLKGTANPHIPHTENDTRENLDHHTLACVSHLVRTYLEELP